MSIYNKLQGRATALLTKFDQGGQALVEMTLVPAASEFDAPTASETVTPLIGTVKGVSQRYIDGVNVVSSDLEATVAVGDYVVSLGDKLRIDDKDYTVLAFKPIPPAGTVVVNKIIIRG